jgi:cell division protease FtsH
MQKNHPNFPKNLNQGHKKVISKIKKPIKKPRGFWNNMMTIVLILFVISFLYSFITERKNKIEEVPISEIAQDVKKEIVEKIEIEGEKLNVSLKLEERQTEDDRVLKKSKKEVDTALSETLSNYGVTSEQLEKLTIEVKDPSGFVFWLGVLAPFIFPLLFVIILIWYLSRQVKGAGMQAFSFGQSKARIIDPKDEKQKVTFKDVAGVKEAKEELAEIVDFLKNPKKFITIGARIPKGVLLMGAPGTGKTLLARAVAGEAGVAFFSISGSEFVEMFVGVGASRVRDLFKLAKQAAPAIIFIDEIDAVGRARGVGMGGGNDEREQTLNQILVEMDGFEPNEKVIVMAATNRPDVLDPAILRPGRFDRRVTLDLPDREDREKILEIHAKGKPLAEDIDLKLIAARTPGFSGADLYSLMNEAAILAAREDRKKVAQFDLIRSIEKVMLGPERRSHLITGKEREITAYHEAGHALVGSVLEHSDPIHKISIVSRGDAGGYTLKIPEIEKRLHSKKDFLDDIAMTFGGLATEQEVFGDVTTGPSGDIQMATRLARNMVTRFGMSDAIGPVALANEPGKVMPGFENMNKEHSDKVAADIDAEIKRIVEEGRERAREIIKEHRKVLDAIAKRLLEVETLERDEYEDILIANGIDVKRKKEEKKTEKEENKE